MGQLQPRGTAPGAVDALTITVGTDGSWSLQAGGIRPEDWVSEKADPSVPHSVLAAETERSPDGGFGYQAG